ncbi:MAG: CcdB family protein [Rhodocyclaceae bacterium]
MRHHAYALKQTKRSDRPYVVDLQNNLLADLGTRLVAPLQRRSSVNSAEIIDELMPILTIDGEEFVLFTQEAAAYPVKGLAHAVADLTFQSSVLTNALDRLVG